MVWQLQVPAPRACGASAASKPTARMRAAAWFFEPLGAVRKMDPQNHRKTIGKWWLNGI